MKKEDLPKTIPVFPLSNFIIFPRTTVPLNIFEPRYIDMINDSMKSNKLIGMIQPKNLKESEVNPELYDIGCMGKITSFRENDNGQFLIELKGVIRFQKIDEVKSNKKLAAMYPPRDKITRGDIIVAAKRKAMKKPKRKR